MMRRMRQEQANDYQRTTMQNVEMAISNQKLKEDTEASIKYLEEQESRMLSQM